MSVAHSLKIAVLTVSDSRCINDDRSGDVLVRGIESANHRLYGRQIVKDDCYQIRRVLSQWIADDGCEVVLTTGGTGVTGRDGTPEAILPLLDKQIPGFAELFRWLSYQEIGTSTLQSRALAGVANGTYVFVLPGSPSACQTAWEKIIAHQLDSQTKPCNLVQLLPRLQER